MALGAIPSSEVTQTPSRDVLHVSDGEALQAMKGLISLAVEYLLRAEANRILLEVEGAELPKRVRNSVSRKIRDSERLVAVTLIQREAVQATIHERHPEAVMN